MIEVTGRKSNYDKYPSTAVDGVIVVETYPGADEDDICQAFSSVFRKVTRMDSLFKEEDKIRRMTAPIRQGGSLA